MKELSIEEKAERYDEIIIEFKPIYDLAKEQGRIIDVEEFERIFPELKESESDDERIRKALIEHVKGIYKGCCTEEASKERDMFLAWLEKQGEHANFRNKIQIGDKVTRNEAGILVNISQLNRVAKPAKKRGKNKVEPKFHEGEWITNGDYTGKIVEVKPLYYILQSQDGNIVDDTISHVDKQFHSFTIKDAKAGDVLVIQGTDFSYESIFIFNKIENNHINQYLHYFITDEGEEVCKVKSVGGFIGYVEENVHPATKEQRNQLEKAMADAGYAFDFEKKKLKEIEQKPTDKEMKETLRTEYEKGRADAIAEMQKPAWSEEDETKIKSIIAFLKSPSLCAMDGNKGIIDESIKYLNSLKDKVQPQPKQEWSKDDENNILFLTSIIEECFKDKENITLRRDTICANFTKENVINRLKSLRPQNTWKPSDEQINALEYYIYSNSPTATITKGTIFGNIMVELLEQLKKLKKLS